MLIEDLERVAKGLAPKEATTRTLNPTKAWDRGAEICNRCTSIAHTANRYCGVCGDLMPSDHQLPVPNPQISGQVYAMQGIPASRNRRKSLKWIIAISVLLVLVAGTVAVAYAAFGPGADLPGRSGSQPSGTEGNASAPEVGEGKSSPSISPKPSEKSPPVPPSAASSASPDAPFAFPKAKSTASNADNTEAGAEEAAGDYYRKAGLKDWDYTYEHLDSEIKRLFAKEEWSQKNQWFADNNSVIYHILSVEMNGTSEEPVAEVAVRLTGEDGSSFTRNTYFVYEDGDWKHRFSEEETKLFMPGVPFEEFVEAL